MRVLVQLWETRRGNKSSPDGYTIHPDQEARDKFFLSVRRKTGYSANYNGSYYRPSAEPYWAEVDEKTHQQAQKTGAIRYYGTPPTKAPDL